jgi:hypothetical protein
MTRIGSSTPSAGGGRPAEKVEAGERNAPDAKVMKKTARNAKKPVESAEAKKAGLFHRKMQEAMHKGKAPAEFEGDSGKTLLAMVHPGTPGQAAHTGPAAVEGSVGNMGVQRVEWAENLFSRIEQAMEASGRKQGDTITLTFELSAHETGGLRGLRGVQISMSPTALDVVLTRTDGQATVEYLAATQVLAERLHERYSRRIVRIHEVAEQQKLASGEMDRISEILRKPDESP